jgi:hypothetical protein
MQILKLLRLNEIGVVRLGPMCPHETKCILHLNSIDI